MKYQIDLIAKQIWNASIMPDVFELFKYCKLPLRYLNSYL